MQKIVKALKGRSYVVFVTETEHCKESRSPQTRYSSYLQ